MIWIQVRVLSGSKRSNQNSAYFVIYPPCGWTHFHRNVFLMYKTIKYFTWILLLKKAFHPYN